MQEQYFHISLSAVATLLTFLLTELLHVLMRS